MIFLATDAPPVAYGVLALTEPFEDLVGPYLPVWTETVLLPYKDKIIYDGLLSSYNMSFGPGIRRSLNDDYRAAKDRLGIVTSLPIVERPKKPTKKTSRKTKKAASNEVRDVLSVIVGMTDEFCRDHLNDEYTDMCRKLAEKLARKRPSPLLRGRPNTWASGVVRTIGWVNFLHDSTQTPHMPLRDIDDYFNISESTGAAKLREMRTMLRIRQLDPHWTLPSRMDDNPLVWMLEVNGFIMDIRDCPREAQEIAFEKGLIPYIPSDHGQIVRDRE
jgi:hypothetical protein